MREFCTEGEMLSNDGGQSGTDEAHLCQLHEEYAERDGFLLSLAQMSLICASCTPVDQRYS